VRVAVLGASGFIGKHLAAALRARGDDVVALSLRDPHAAARAAADCDAAVNLAGESLAQRWSAGVKRRIVESRADLPARFLDALGRLEAKPKTYVSASAIGYYGTSETATFTEESPPGNDFLAQVCVAWEHTAQKACALGMRVAKVRAGLVLGTDGGALAKLLPLFKAGTGGRAGSGNQWYSWIHIDDAVAVYMLAIDRVEGTLNATAPNPVRNQEFTQVLANVLHRPAALPAPAFMIKVALGEGAVLVLEGQRVLPERAMREGYRFKYETLEPALGNLID
jgi:uncharacterized protein (TIGR01777 family)